MKEPLPWLGSLFSKAGSHLLLTEQPTKAVGLTHGCSLQPPEEFLKYH